MSEEYIIAYADKSVLKIAGLTVKGVNTRDLEKRLSDKLHSLVRVIGVTGSEIELDVYDLDPELIRKNEKGLIEAVSLTEGITATEVATLSCSEKIVEINFDEIPDQPISSCARERWIKRS